jgi:peptide-methionine (S)-S-oxide reductase
MKTKLLLLLAVAGTCAVPGRAAAAGAGHGHPRAVAVLAGGCCWGVESVFRHVRGVESATSGYSYPVPGAGVRSTARVESVRIVYDPSRLSYRRILDVFFSVVQDPTELDRQGPDVGTDYRSIVFVNDDSGRAVVRAYVDSLTAAHVFPRPIVTEIDALRAFEPVVASQQDYAAKHPDNPYIVANDVPKLAALRQRFPGLYRG